jgi:hypothetical protein
MSVVDNVSLDDQLNQLERSVTGTIHSTNSNSSLSSTSEGSKPWSAYIRLAISAAISGTLLAAFRPIWIYRFQYTDDDTPQRKVLWVKAAGAWIGITLIIFALYHFLISKYVKY